MVMIYLKRFSDMDEVFVHESSYVDEGCSIGAGTEVWQDAHA